MKKTLLVFLSVLLVLMIMLVPVSALSIDNISSMETKIGTYNGISSNTKTFNSIFSYPKTFRDHYIKTGGDVYIRLYMYETNTGIFNYIEQEYGLEYDSIESVPLVVDAASPLSVKDFTGIISFYNDVSIRPQNVYLVSYENDLDVSDHPFGFSPDGYLQRSYQYTVRYEFILKYNIAQFYEPTVTERTDFYDSKNPISFIPHLQDDLKVYNLGLVIVAPLDIIVKPYKVCSYVPRPSGSQEKPYRVRFSTNMFSALQMWVGLETVTNMDGTLQPKFAKSPNYATTFGYAFSQNAQYKSYVLDRDTIFPFYYDPNKNSVGIYRTNDFIFKGQATSFYAMQMNANYLRWRENVDDFDGYHTVGYVYNTSPVIVGNYCNNNLFSVGCWTAYQDDYFRGIDYDGANVNGTFDTKQFYQDISITYNNEEGLVKGLSEFFANLFTDTLPAIINNFVVWICLEAPLVSKVLSPMYLALDLTGRYVVQLFIPLLSALGIFGVVMITIFVIKRVIPLFVGGSE